MAVRPDLYPPGMQLPRRWPRVAGVVLLLLALLGAYLLHDPTGEGGNATGGASSGTAAVAGTPELLRRGEYLARIGNCENCHTARGGAPYAGGRAIETPFGAVYSPNITPDRLRGIGSWSADDFWRALHFGIGPDARRLSPAFPYTSYTRVTRADADALFAYLQSVPGAFTLNQPSALRWPYGTQWALRVWRTLYFTPVAASANADADADAGDAALQRGAYLVRGLGHCVECHSARVALGGHPDSSLGGVLPGSQWYAPPLGAGGEASVAQWPPAAVAKFLITGIGPAGNASGPMAEVVLHGTQYLSADDALAMARYLQAPGSFAPAAASAAALGGGATPANPGPAARQSAGQQLYQQNCSDCHGAQGQGQGDIYPALAGNRHVTLSNHNNLIHQVLAGGFAPATAGNPRPYGMPPFMLRLSDAEIAQLLSYVRTAWGNQGTGIREIDVQLQRQLQAP